MHRWSIWHQGLFVKGAKLTTYWANAQICPGVWVSLLTAQDQVRTAFHQDVQSMTYGCVTACSVYNKCLLLTWTRSTASTIVAPSGTFGHHAQWVWAHLLLGYRKRRSWTVLSGLCNSASAQKYCSCAVSQICSILRQSLWHMYSVLLDYCFPAIEEELCTVWVTLDTLSK